MKVGFVGLGKLGLPCALAIERAGGHAIYGYETSTTVCEQITERRIPYKEVGAQALLETSRLQLVDLPELVQVCDLIFVAVQTPHDPRYEGVTRLPEERVDFDYRYLVEAMRELAEAAKKAQKRTLVSVISTVLPGTIQREVQPVLNEFVRLCYNPFFIAMGTTIHDFLHPEFVLLGGNDLAARDEVAAFYGTLHDAPVHAVSIESAELIKVAYNTFIGMKIVFANTLMEICHGTGADVDAVTNAIAKATVRLLSPKYLRAGMGDGGGCHPRDNIAMSHLAQRLGLSYDFFESLMLAREKQTEWLADLALELAREQNLPIVVMGKAFKPETNLITGSPSILLHALLQEKGAHPTIFDPHLDPPEVAPRYPAVYVVGTEHEVFQEWSFPEGSLVLDPWRSVPDRDGVDVRRLGQASSLGL